MPLRAPKGFIDESDPKVCQIGHPAPPWLVNYADLMTELVCFFVILYALSAALNKDVQKAKQEVEQSMKEEKAKVEVKVDREGMKIGLQENGEMAFFESGKADITPGMAELLGKLAPKLKDLTTKYDLIVEGHTDNIPINDEYFGSNWELSTARATTVVDYLIKEKGFSPLNLAAAGYGEFRPVCPANDTPQCRSQNRRIVFFIKTTSPHKVSGEGPAAQKPVATLGAAGASGVPAQVPSAAEGAAQPPPVAPTEAKP